MARDLAWTETAWRDLEGIADHIAEDSPGYAAAFVRRVRDQSRSLDEFAERGRVVPELADARVRELLVGSYRLIYEVDVTVVDVLGARDLAAIGEHEARPWLLSCRGDGALAPQAERAWTESSEVA